MNVKINLTDSKSFKDDSKIMDWSTNSVTSKDTHDQGKLSILERLRQRHGYSSNRSKPASERSVPYSKTQWKSFNLLDPIGNTEAIDSEPIALNKPYMTPLINTFDSHRVKNTSSSISKQPHARYQGEPKSLLSNIVRIELSDHRGKGGHVKGKQSKQFKKTNIYSLLGDK